MSEIRIDDMITSLEEIAKDLKEVRGIIETSKANGCYECAFESCEEWELPCSKCKRNMKDYWRAKEQKNEHSN